MILVLKAIRLSDDSLVYNTEIQLSESTIEVVHESQNQQDQFVKACHEYTMESVVSIDNTLTPEPIL